MNKNVLSVVGVVGLVLGAALSVRCTHQQQQAAVGVLRAADSGCVVVQQVHDPEGRVSDVCVAVEEVRAAVEAILRAQAALKAASSASSTPSASASGVPR